MATATPWSDDDLVRVAEAASVLGVPVLAIYRLIEDQRIERTFQERPNGVTGEQRLVLLVSVEAIRAALG